jgi:hypothetical protein
MVRSGFLPPAIKRASTAIVITVLDRPRVPGQDAVWIKPPDQTFAHRAGAPKASVAV